MRYEKELLLRVALCFLILLMPIDLFYLILLKPTIYLSSIFLSSYNPAIVGDSLIINNTVLRFIPACIASLAYILLLLLVLLTKDLEWKRRMNIFLVGSAAIFLANIIRVDVLIYVYFEYGNAMFNKIHLLIWDAISSIFVAFLWIILTYIYKIKNIPFYDDIKELHERSRKN